MQGISQGTRSGVLDVAPRQTFSPAKSRTDFLRVAVALLIIMEVSRAHQLIPPIAAIRPALLLQLAAIGYVALVPKAISRENVLGYWWVRLVLAIVAQAVMSALFGISLGASSKFILLVFSTVLFVVGLTVVCVRNTRDFMVMVAAFMIGLGALAYQTNFMFQLRTWGGIDRLDSMFAFDANDVGLIFVTGLPLAASLIPAWRWPARPLMLLLLASLGVGIARTGSRGAFLALLISGIAMLMFNRGVRVVHRMFFAGAVAGALILAAPPGYFKQMQTIGDPTDDYNWSSPYGRREIAKRGIGYMMSHPLFGVGINNFRKAECTISPRVQLEADGFGFAHCAAPHNTWIQVGAELGFPGLLMWIAMLVIPSARLFRLSRKLPDDWRRGDKEQRFLFACASALPISILGFMIGSSFLSFAWIGVSYLLVSFAGSTWLLCTRRLASDRRLSPLLR